MRKGIVDFIYLYIFIIWLIRGDQEMSVEEMKKLKRQSRSPPNLYA